MTILFICIYAYIDIFLTIYKCMFAFLFHGKVHTFLYYETYKPMSFFTNFYSPQKAQRHTKKYKVSALKRMLNKKCTPLCVLIHFFHILFPDLSLDKCWNDCRLFLRNQEMCLWDLLKRLTMYLKTLESFCAAVFTPTTH